jgi:hypothetical protein
VGGDDPGRSLRFQPPEHQADRHLRPDAHRSTNFHARREDEDALNRSDRQRESSTNPSRPSIGRVHVVGMKPR